MISNSILLQQYNSLLRKINMRVELLDGSTVINSFYPNDKLKSYVVERIGEEKFFGFGICQKLKVQLVDTNKELTITAGQRLKVSCIYDDNGTTTAMTPYPTFDIYEVERDENSGDLTIIAYDALYKARELTFADLTISQNFTLLELGSHCANSLGLTGLRRVNTGQVFFDSYPAGANFSGTETLREVLNALADATQCIYFINYNNYLSFIRLNQSGDPVYTIDKEKYFTLSSGSSRKLTAITYTNELGNNVTAQLDGEGDSNQFINDNAFWEMREDIGALVEAAIQAVGNLTLYQFKCDWRGCPLVEIGDKIALVGKDGEIITSYLLNDTTTYDGSFNQKSEWSFSQTKEETFTNSSTLGDRLKHTYARVDKVEQKIEMVASDTEATKGSISSLQITTDEISANIEGYKSVVDMTNNEVETLKKEVNAKMSAEDVSILITNETSKGSTKVVTETGFRFDDEGLTVSKSGSEMTTTITEDGMTVYRDNTAVLTANNSGVDATNLRATTYLIIGNNSRFEDYGSGRTGCFWIGG